MCTLRTLKIPWWLKIVIDRVGLGRHPGKILNFLPENYTVKPGYLEFIGDWNSVRDFRNSSWTWKPHLQRNRIKYSHLIGLQRVKRLAIHTARVPQHDDSTRGETAMWWRHHHSPHTHTPFPQPLVARQGPCFGCNNNKEWNKHLHVDLGLPAARKAV